MENKQQTGTVWVLRYNCPSGYGREIYGIYASEDAAADACNDELFPEYLQTQGVLEDSLSENDYEAWVEPFYKDFDPIIEQLTIQETKQ